jgi:hypothetical protein
MRVYGFKVGMREDDGWKGCKKGWGRSKIPHPKRHKDARGPGIIGSIRPFNQSQHSNLPRHFPELWDVGETSATLQARPP